MTYRAHGKQVLRNMEHVCDAADETWAQIITDALNGERMPEPHGGGADYFVPLKDEHVVMINRLGDHRCSCGRNWDRDEGDECPATR